uniref:Peroxin/Ferlin domain-containing protein n=1 Tax=Macrostomum lignano TaxID=282301 RepID=A0A1I8G4J4_9PLAT
MACGSGSLYALDLAGRVFSISSSSSEWQPVSSGQSKLRHFKRLAPASWCLWAIGNDQQLFLMVLSSDMKIRYQESVVEHERYSPIGGFSGAKLLNNDPPHFALQVRQSAFYKPVSLRSVRPPSSRWTWEDDWHLEEAGPATDKLGWQYALDFNKAFAPERRIAFVRKRRWLRHRYFSATDRWLLIPAPSSQFPTDDPFREVSVGGQWMPHQNDGYLALWAVTVKGQLVYRTGVDRLCPEGLSWWLVSPPSNTEQVTGVSVGPLGSVLTVTDAGGVYVRTGITWQCVTGADWVSHGVRSMWAVTNTGRIWFRRGVNFSSDQSALQAGYSWVEMIGLFRQVSVSPTDQVWGIDLVSNQLLYRTGIESRKELLSSSSGAAPSLSASAAAASGSGAFAASSAADSVELGVAAEEADEKGQHEEEEAGEESAESDEARLSRQMTGFIQFVDPPPLPMIPASLAAATVVGGGVEKCAAYEAPLLLAVMDLSASALPLLGGAISTLWHPARRRGGGCSCDSQLDLSALESAVLYQLVQRDNREYKSPRFAHFGSVAREESGLWKAEKVTHWHHETGRGCEAQLALVASAGGAKAELVLTPAMRRRQQQQQTGGGKSAAQRAERRIPLESVTCVAQLSNRPACLAVYTENCYHAL